MSERADLEDEKPGIKDIVIDLTSDRPPVTATLTGVTADDLYAAVDVASAPDRRVFVDLVGGGGGAPRTPVAVGLRDALAGVGRRAREAATASAAAATGSFGRLGEIAAERERRERAGDLANPLRAHARSLRRRLRAGETPPRAEHYRAARDASGVDPVAALRRYAAERRALGVLRVLSLAAADRILAADPADLDRLALLSNPGTTELGTGETA